MFQTVGMPLYLIGLGIWLCCISQDQPAAVVTGHVLDWKSGQPVKNATVELTVLPNRPHDPAPENGPVGALRATHTVLSGRGGEFRFDSVTTGQYTLSAKKTGFLDSNYGATSPFQLPAILDLRAGQTVNVAVHALPHGIICGQVTETDGEPLDTGSIQLISTFWLRGKLRNAVVKSVVPNDLGEYRIAGLQPGTYYIRFQPRTSGGTSRNVNGPVINAITAEARDRHRPVPTYHPSAMTLREAFPIVVGLGELVSGKDIVVRRAATFAVAGRLRKAGPPPDFASVSLVPDGEEPTAVIVGKNALGPGGSFAFGDVAPGDYTLSYLAGTAQGVSVGTASVSVLDRAITDLVIDVVPPVSVHGSVIIENDSGKEVSDVKVRLVTAGAAIGPGYTASVERDGRFVFGGCSPGQYSVGVRSPTGIYLKAARYGLADVTNSPVTISAENVKLEIVLRNGAARLSGTILPARGADGARGPGSGYYVVLPADRPTEQSEPRLGHSDNSGKFEVKNLAPGRYRVFGFVAPDPGALQNPAVLKAIQALGTEIELKEDEQATVAIHLIGADDGGRVFGLAR